MRLVTHCMLGLGLAWVVLGMGVAIVAAAEQTASDARKPQIPELKVEKYTLPNGLTVILHEDHKTPVASVCVLYKVGSKDEKLGRTGFAHLFEHMMFQGSKHHDTDYFLPLEKLGADLNGRTAEDQTIYYETVPQQRARAGPLARGRSDGLSAAVDDAAEARQPARRGQERAPADGRQRALRPGRGGAARRRSIPQTIPITTA